MTNSTVTGNRADSDGNGSGEGGGISAVGAETLNNTIVAGNFNEDGATDAPNDINGNPINTANYNLIGDASTSGGITHGANGNIVGNSGTGTIDINTVLDTNLANNGGPTETHALVCGSPAIDQGKNFTTDTTDQRGTGFARTFNDPNVDDAVGGDGTDIGAYESQTTLVTTFYRDADGDTFGDPNTSVEACSAPSGFVTDNTDCDDSMSSVNPGAAEVCHNGIDDNCNGTIDEECPVLAPADLDIEKDDASDPVLLGSNITYKIEVENDGPGNATGVVVTDLLPSSVSFVSASAGCVYAPGNHSVTCTIGNLAEDQEAKRTIVVQTHVAGNVFNSARVTANEPDPDSSNNIDSAQTRVVIGVASLTLSPNPVRGGNNSTGTLTLSAPSQGNTVVKLSSSNTSVAKSAVSSITISNGNTSGTFTVKTFRVSSDKTVKIKASANGTTKEASLTVKR